MAEEGRIVNGVAWRIGGQQGEGIDSTGDIFAKACARYGLRLYTYRHFSSRIRGGLTFSEIRVSDAPVAARSDEVNYVVALGQEVVDSVLDCLADDAVLIYDKDAFEPQIDKDLVEAKRVHLVGVPMTKLAEEKGGRIAKNMVSLGATARFLQMDPAIFYEFVEEKFGRKGQKIVDMNKAVIKAGYDFVGEHHPKRDGHVLERRPLPANRRRIVATGNFATAFGALTAGCRFVAGYPITPATEVMEWMIDHVDDYGGVVVQAEDELSAINQVLGAGYAGVRAMTSTSGPGLSLMTEAVGLAGMAEIPIVVVDVMRPGPSTGLPTKHSQADLMFAIYGGHDDWPRIVLSPSTVEEAYYLVQEAFNWSEEYQCPCFFLVDQDLGIQHQAIDDLDTRRIPIQRGKLLTEAQLRELPTEGFKRFEFTPDGVSPRSLPGFANGLYLSSGSEHDERSVITENVRNRTRMMEKRMRKMQSFRERSMRAEFLGREAWGFTAGDSAAKVGVVTWGSTRGPVEEAIARIEADGGPAMKRLVLNVLWPFPTEPVAEFMKGCDTVLVIEANMSGQLATIIKQEIGGHEKIRRVNKYDGTPFRPHEIQDALTERI